VLQVRVNFGRIHQKGGRLGEKDGEIGMCIVVEAVVGSCQHCNANGSELEDLGGL